MWWQHPCHIFLGSGPPHRCIPSFKLANFRLQWQTEKFFLSCKAGKMHVKWQKQNVLNRDLSQLVKTQYLQIFSITDTSIKHPTSVYTSLPMYLCTKYYTKGTVYSSVTSFALVIFFFNHLIHWTMLAPVLCKCAAGLNKQDLVIERFSC